VLARWLLASCEPSAYQGGLERISTRLQKSLAAQEVNLAPLGDLLDDITAMNVAECELDSGSVMPPARVAARAMTHVGFAFCGDDSGANWLADAMTALLILDPSLGRAALVSQLKTEISALEPSR